MSSAISVRRNSVAILGFHEGNAGQVETWFEEVTGYHIACFVHESAEPLRIDVRAENRKRVTKRMEYPAGHSYKGRPFFVSKNWSADLRRLGIKRVLPLTSNDRDRLRQIRVAKKYGLELVSAIHPSAIILPGATVAPGCWVNARAVIGYKAEIESGVMINTGVIIEHHNVLRGGCQVDPGAVTCGNVTLEECSHVHAGAVISPRVTVGKDAIIGAGAVVINDIPPRCTAVGVPAIVIKRH